MTGVPSVAGAKATATPPTLQNLQWSQAEDWCVVVLVLTLVGCLKARLSVRVEFFEAVGRGSKIQYFFQLSLLATTKSRLSRPGGAVAQILLDLSLSIVLAGNLASAWLKLLLLP